MLQRELQKAGSYLVSRASVLVQLSRLEHEQEPYHAFPQDSYY